MAPFLVHYKLKMCITWAQSVSGHDLLLLLLLLSTYQTKGRQGENKTWRKKFQIVKFL
jgi:hypothetical protein